MILWHSFIYYHYFYKDYFTKLGTCTKKDVYLTPDNIKAEIEL